MIITLDEFMPYRPPNGKKLIALFGHPIAHTLSPELHKLLLREAGLSAKYEYIAVDVPPERFAEAFEAAKNKTAGINCTLPYKTIVIPLLDRLDDGAARMAAVNTVVFKKNRRGGNFCATGYNTDIEGMSSSMRAHNINTRGIKVTILGDGGTARMALCLLSRAGAKITLASRNPERAAQLITELGFPHIAVRDIAVVQCGELAINCTSCGMYPNIDESPLKPWQLTGTKAIFDCVYNPEKTALMAMKPDAIAINGLEMLVKQGAESERLWMPSEAAFSAAQLREAVTKLGAIQTAKRRLAEKNKRFIVLTGFMASGKTTTGKLLAKKLCCEHMDLDKEIERREKATISEIFAQVGEAGFRRAEYDAMKALTESCNAPMAVISTGGGAVTNEATAALMREYGEIFFLDARERTILSRLVNGVKGRPMLDGGNLKLKLHELYGARHPIYLRTADKVFSADSGVTNACRAILEYICG